MKIQHPSLVSRWKNFSLMEQLAHVGSEVERTIKWKEKGNDEYSHLAFSRALELLDLTISSYTEFAKLKELIRVRELLVDYFQSDNQFGSSDKSWRNYFYPFYFAARNQKSK